MMRVADRLAAPIGLTGSRWMTLCVLAEEGRPLTQSELGDRMLLSAQNISRMIQTLEADGLVARRTKPGAGRAVFVELTPDGIARRNQAKLLGDAFLENFLIGLSSNRVASLETDLQSLIDNVIAYEAKLTSEERPA